MTKISHTLDHTIVQKEFERRAVNRKGLSKVLSTRYPLKENRRFDDIIQNLLFTYLDSSFSQIIEVGVGTGRVAKFFAPRTTSYIGLDFSEKMIITARKSLQKHPNVTFQISDAVNIEYPKQSFDLGVVSLVLKHNSDARAKQIIDNLKKFSSRILLIEHVSGGAGGSNIAIIRSAEWYMKQFEPFKPEVTTLFKRHNDNILFSILSK